MDDKAINLITPPLYKLANKLLACFPKTSYTVDLLVADIFYEVFKMNIPNELDKSPLAYLYGIGKNLLKQEQKKMGREILMGNNSMDNFANTNDIDGDENSVLMDRLRLSFNKLPNSCRKLFICLSEKENIMEAIEFLQYNNSETLSSRKHQCLKRLKKIIKQDDPGLAKILGKKKLM